jgi:hypothetical protein
MIARFGAHVRRKMPFIPNDDKSVEGVTQMTIVKRLKSIWSIIQVKFTLLKTGQWRSFFSKTLNETPRQLHVTEEFRTGAFPGPATSTREVEAVADMKDILHADASPGQVPDTRPVQTEADFHGLNNLEAFAKEATVTQEMIEKWVAAGILSPQETLVAEKLIKLMRQNAHRSTNGENGSPLN